jgi:hypothetical protein
MDKNEIINQSKYQLNDIINSYNIYNSDIILNAIKVRFDNDLLRCDYEKKEKKIFTKKEIKLLSKTFDELYNLNSLFNYKFECLLIVLKDFVEQKGYQFILKYKTQKFKLELKKND